MFTLFFPSTFATASNSSNYSSNYDDWFWYEQRRREREEEERRQNEFEEKKRKEASEELPKALDEVRNNYSEKFNDKILKYQNKIKEELDKYPIEEIKVFVQNICQNRIFKNKLVENAKKESENILSKFFNKASYFNILLQGITGVGKSQLIKGVFDFGENEGPETGIGKPVQKEFTEYISDNRKGLRCIDSRGIEMGEYGIQSCFNSAKELIEKRAQDNDTNKLIHCIWYCMTSNNLRFQPEEKEILNMLMNQYDDNSLPIIIVITQSYDDERTQIMCNIIKEEFAHLKRDITILPVIAKEIEIVKKNQHFVFQKEGIDELIKASFEKSKNAVYPAYMKFIREKIIQMFYSNFENKKNTLENDIGKNIQPIQEEFNENNKFEDNILKLSNIIDKVFNTFLDAINICEELKEEITLYLNNLGKWCVENLCNIVKELIIANSKELGSLLYEEQNKIKNKHNTYRRLDKEKNVNEYQMQCENELRIPTANKVNFLAAKYVFEMFYKNFIEISKSQLEEQFKEMIPELKNYISDQKVKELSNKALNEIMNLK